VEIYVETKLARAAGSPLQKELRSVTGYVRRITSEGDIYERLFMKEWQDAAQKESNTQSVNEAEIPTDEESLVCQIGASRE
jgi:hypothetical protein